MIPAVPFDAVDSLWRDMAMAMAIATLMAYSVLIYGSMALEWALARRR